MNHHLISALILMAALGLYAMGITTTASFLLIFGFIFEIWFWLRVSTSSKKSGK
jgi:hypothetical protein